MAKTPNLSKSFISQQIGILSHNLFVCILCLHLPEKELPNKVENLDATED